MPGLQSALLSGVVCRIGVQASADDDDDDDEYLKSSSQPTTALSQNVHGERTLTSLGPNQAETLPGYG